MFEVKDGSRTFQFNGRLLGESSSRYADSLRWIEFQLYKSESGSYIISRIGVSIVFHGAACFLVKKYNLTEGLPENLRPSAYPCLECSPSKNLPFVFPEKDRTWAYVTDDPQDVIDALYKYDDKNNGYLTNVAKRLLESATKNDENLDMVYRLETIP